MHNRRALILLLTANAISGISQGLTIMAVPWYFIHISKQEKLYGIMFAVLTAITLFWSLYAGTIVDRYSRKKVFLGINIAGGLTMGGMAALGFATGSVNDLMVMTAYGITILIFNVHYPTLYALGQEITAREHYGKINSLIEIIGQSTSMIAGAVGAFLLGGTAGDHPIKKIMDIDIEPWSIHEIFALDAATYAVAIFLIAMMRYAPVTNLPVDKSKLVNRLKAGVRFLADNKPLFWFGYASYAIFIALIVEAFYLMQMYVSNHLGEEAWVFASAEMLYATGALMAGIFIRKLFRKTVDLKAILILMFSTFLLFMWAGMTQSAVVFFVFSLLFGLTNAGTRILRITFLFNRVPNNMIGRANSIFNALNIATRVAFLSLFSISFFTEGSNVTYAFIVLGFFILLMTIPIIKHYTTLTVMKEDDLN